MQNMEKVKIWGVIQDEEGHAIPYVYVRLLRKIKHNDSIDYQVVRECYADKEGNYVFFVPREKERVYKVVVIWNL